VPPRKPSIALVTGAGSEGGIGFAVARRLVATGAHVALVATSDRIHDRASSLGPAASGHVCDLRDDVAVDALIADLSSRGRLDVVVNNAGMTSVGAGADAGRLVHELTTTEWDDTLRRNLTTAFAVCRAVVPGMRRRKYGRIVNVASTTGPLSAFERAGGYAAAKAGMVGLTRSLALENGRFGITVNAVAPGWIDTPSATAGERRAGAASPVGRSGTADEVAAAIAFLCSPDASYVSGHLLVVDGANDIVEDLAGR
jgi:3-oxoacyl-[acyl-carrier protein] reductase